MPLSQSLLSEAHLLSKLSQAHSLNVTLSSSLFHRRRPDSSSTSPPPKLDVTDPPAIPSRQSTSNPCHQCVVVWLNSWRWLGSLASSCCGGGSGGFHGGGCGCCLVGLVGVGLVDFFFLCCGLWWWLCVWLHYFIIIDILFYCSRYIIYCDVYIILLY